MSARTLPERITALEERSDSLEEDMKEHAQSFERIDSRLRKLEKILWALLGAVAVVDFGIKLIEDTPAIAKALFNH